MLIISSIVIYSVEGDVVKEKQKNICDAPILQNTECEKIDG